MTKLLLEALATVQPADISDLNPDFRPKDLENNAKSFVQRLFVNALGEALIYELQPRYITNAEWCDFEDNEFVIIEFTAAGVPVVINAKANYPSSIGRSANGDYMVPDASNLVRWSIEVGEFGEAGTLENIATANLKARLLTAIKFAMTNDFDDDDD